MTRHQSSIEKETGKHYRLASFALEFSDKASGTEIPGKIHLIPIGEWEHDLYGTIIITASDIAQFKRNFDAGLRNGVAITAGHEGYEELPAQGWITDVECREDGLWGTVDWTKLGQTTLGDKQFKFFSPEFSPDYEDAETHEKYENVLTGGALTKSPYFKELNAIVFSEKGIKKFNDNNTMDLATITAKKVEDLNDEEKVFLKAHKDELTEEQKTAFTAVIDEPESEEDKAARVAKEEGDANEAAGLNRDGTKKEEGAPAADDAAAEKPPVNASEKVTVSAGELYALRMKANEGAQAFKELKVARIAGEVSKLIFNEKTNKAGVLLPKASANVQSFMEGLTEAQTAQFKTIMASTVPVDTTKFSEIGSGAAPEAEAATEVERRVQVKMSENPTMKYSEALKTVMSEAAAKGDRLEQRYDDGLKKATKDQSIKA
jgi:Mu-like prophage I protein